MSSDEIWMVAAGWQKMLGVGCCQCRLCGCCRPASSCPV